MNYNGFEIINTSTKVIKYPTGKKDGNKLGKRKKSLFYYIANIKKGEAIVDKKINRVYMNHEEYYALEKYIERGIFL